MRVSTSTTRARFMARGCVLVLVLGTSLKAVRADPLDPNSPLFASAPFGDVSSRLVAGAQCTFNTGRGQLQVFSSTFNIGIPVDQGGTFNSSVMAFVFKNLTIESGA